VSTAIDPKLQKLGFRLLPVFASTWRRIGAAEQAGLMLVGFARERGFSICTLLEDHET